MLVADLASDTRALGAGALPFEGLGLHRRPGPVDPDVWPVLGAEAAENLGRLRRLRRTGLSARRGLADQHLDQQVIRLGRGAPSGVRTRAICHAIPRAGRPGSKPTS
jgi:hypothetical protein